MQREYRFGHAWFVSAAPSEVRALLTDVAGYAGWWPSVQTVAGEREPVAWASVVVRAPIGYRLRIRITEVPSRGSELRASISGDLAGWCAWSIGAAPGGTHVRFMQSVRANSAALRVASPLLRGLLRRQHAAVMRAAATGMRIALEHPNRS